MSEKVRLALVGCGDVADYHIRGYRDLRERGCDSFEVVACVDPDETGAGRRADEIAAFQGSRPVVLGSVEALLSAGLADAADVCTPHAFHHTSAVECLDGGLHVMLEKPLGLTIRAGQRIIEAARRNRRILATAENIRRGRGSRACAWALRQRKIIGDVHTVDVVSRCHYRPDLTDPKSKWRQVKLLTGGGMIMDVGAHLTDMMLVLFGPPKTVFCSMRTLEPKPIQDVPVLGSAVVDVEDEWYAVITFAGGVRLMWTTCRCCIGEFVQYGRYYGTQGAMVDRGLPFHPFQDGGEAKLADGTVVSYEQIQREYLDSLSQKEKDRLFPYGATDGFSIEVADFVRAVAGDGPVEIDGQAGLASKAVAMACYESAVAGREVSYDDVLSGAVREYQEPIDRFWKL